jgi:hypothetical protein
VSHDLKLEHLFDALPEVSSAGSPASRPQRSSNADAPDRIVESECELIASGRPRTLPDRKAKVFQGVDWARRLVHRSTTTMTDGSGIEVTFGEQDGRTPVTIAQGGLPAARVRGEFAGGWASILDGLGRAVAARVTDRW